MAAQKLPIKTKIVVDTIYKFILVMATKKNQEIKSLSETDIKNTLIEISMDLQEGSIYTFGERIG